MAIGLTSNKAWFEKGFISVAQTGQSDIELRAVFSTLGISGGESEFDSLEVFGGKISKPSSPTDQELSFDAIVASTRDLDWIKHGVAPTSVAITTSTNKAHRVTMLWTDVTTITSAVQTVGTAGEAYRRSYAELRPTALEYNMDAGEHLTASLTFTGATEDETGGQNYRFQTKINSTAATSVLSALSSYTTGTSKF